MLRGGEVEVRRRPEPRKAEVPRSEEVEGGRRREVLKVGEWGGGSRLEVSLARGPDARPRPGKPL